MRKFKIGIVLFYSIALFFIGMSIFADKTSTVGVVITIVGFSSLLVASVLTIIRAVVGNRKK